MWYPAFIDWCDASVWKDERIYDVMGLDFYPSPPDDWLTGQGGVWMKIADRLWWYDGKSASVRFQQYLVTDDKGRQLAYTPTKAQASLSHPGTWLARVAPGRSGLVELQQSLDDFKPERVQLTRLDVSRDLDPGQELHLTWDRGWSSTQHAVRGVPTGWTIGRGPLLCRVYRKDLHDPGDMCFNRWGRLPTWRVEFQMRTKELRAWGISDLTSIADVDNLWLSLVERMGLGFGGLEQELYTSVEPRQWNKSYPTFGSERALMDQVKGCIRAIGKLRLGLQQEIPSSLRPSDLDEWFTEEVPYYKETLEALQLFASRNPRLLSTNSEKRA